VMQSITTIMPATTMAGTFRNDWPGQRLETVAVVSWADRLLVLWAVPSPSSSRQALEFPCAMAIAKEAKSSGCGETRPAARGFRKRRMNSSPGRVMIFWRLSSR